MISNWKMFSENTTKEFYEKFQIIVDILENENLTILKELSDFTEDELSISIEKDKESESILSNIFNDSHEFWNSKDEHREYHRRINLLNNSDDILKRIKILTGLSLKEYMILSHDIVLRFGY